MLLIDENPFEQKMALEFFMYKDFFQSMGWPLDICDSRALTKADFIYNRCVDFYFENHPPLAEAFLKGTCAISPHPREYYLLSDKNRLCDWFSQKGIKPELKKIQSSLLRSEKVTAQNKEQIWKNRKKYFFKNLRGYGGKQAYRGAGLTHKKFKELYESKSLAQEFVSPLRIKNSKGEEWKVDFRTYVYEDKIQQLAARCYQGQITNFKQADSGFAAVELV